MISPPGVTQPPILKQFISLANWERERAKDKNRNDL